MVDYDELTDLVDIGDVFVVIAWEDNAKGVEYYLFQCNCTKLKLLSNVIDDYGIEYTRDDMFIPWAYFFQVPSHAKWHLAFEGFHFDKTSIQFSHLVIGTKLRMTSVMLKGKEHFQLQICDHEHLSNVICNRC